jgi:hypothetical protein
LKVAATLLTFFILCCSSLFAQVEDFRTWYSISLEKSFSKKLEAGLEQMLRLSENSTQFSQTYSDVGIQYNAVKRLSISANYRFTIRPNENVQRVYSSISYSLKYNDWKAEPRLRVEHYFIPASKDLNLLRPKLSISNKINKRFELFVSGELFFTIFYYEGDMLNQYRLSAGTDYNFNRKNSLQLYYIYEKEVNVNAASLNHILGVGYKYKFE